MKALLLSVSSESFFYDQVVVPFGLASLGSYVARDGVELKGLEMNWPPERIAARYLREDPDLLDEIAAFAPDVVAMTAYSGNIHNVLFWADAIKRRVPNGAVIVGGNHASYIAEEIVAERPSVDAVCRFEGEQAFSELCRRVADGARDFGDIPSLVWRRDGAVVVNDLAATIPDLDDLPPLNDGLFETGRPEARVHADLITARGCPFHCTFCNCNHYWGKKYRTFSTDRVVEELRRLKARYPALETVRFRDESMTISKPRCLELCEKLIAADLGLRFHAHSRLDGLDADVIPLLARAGFEQLYIGLESGSQAVLERLRKGIRVERVAEVVRLLRENGVAFRVSLILGTPDETLDEAMETVGLVKRHDLTFDEFYFGVGIVIYPGTTDCETFLRRSPDHQWLTPSPLPDGYTYRRDSRGNVTAILHLGMRYELPALYERLNAQLSDRLVTEGERDYFDYRSAVSLVERIAHDHGSEDAARARLRELLKAVDELGKPWAIFRDGLFYRRLVGPTLADLAPRNFVGVFSPWDEDASVRQSLRTVRTVLLAITEKEARGGAVRDVVLERWRFRGKAVLLDTLLRETAAGAAHDPPALLAGHDFEPDLSLRYRLGRLLRRLGLYGIARKLLDCVRGGRP